MNQVVITIARQYGSGGRTVGKMLAERLGISFYDKQIIQMASDESGIDVKLFGKVEEGDKVKGSLFGNKESIYKGNLHQPGSKEFISDENLFNYQAKVVNDLAEKESYVIVGQLCFQGQTEYIACIHSCTMGVPCRAGISEDLRIKRGCREIPSQR